jgi:hypothetical protein
MRTTALLLSALFVSPAALAQSRVNDTLPKAPEQRLTPDFLALDLTLGGTYSRGNVDNRALTGSAAFALHPAPAHRLYLDLSGSYNAFGDAIVLDRQQGALLYAWGVAEHMNVFFYTTHARNRFLKLDYRTDNSVGVCVHSFLPDVLPVLLLSLGVTPEWERWQGGADDANLRATLRLRAEMPVTAQATLGLDVTYTPVLAHPGRYRLFGNAFAELKITPDLLAFRLTASDEYDTRPQPGVKRNDVSLVSSLVVKLAM